MTKKLIPIILALLTTISPIANARVKAHGLVGSSSDPNNPFHVSLGIGLAKELGSNFYAGLDGNLLLENTNYEISYALDLEQNVKDYSFGLGIGFSRTHLDEPIHVSSGIVKEPIPEESFLLRPYLTRSITSKLRLVSAYTRNFADVELHDKDYPQHRFSLGLSVLFK